MRLLLAPMEGLLDYTLRDILTSAGGITQCVSEFIRVTDSLLPERVFYRVMPELWEQGGCTSSGVPVRGQLLGSDPGVLADNAGRLALLSPHGVDLNFGCPARIVNRHGGGASLLDDPEQLFRIVSEVARAVPAATVVSAKMRLGTDDDALALDCALALEAGGAQELVVHGRTRAQGYRPPAYWDRIGEVRRAVRIPVVANGEVWTLADARRCLAESGCDSLMLGRGMVADPGLAGAVQADRGLVFGLEADAPSLNWADIQALFRRFWGLVQVHTEPRYQAGRLKQWLNLLRRRYPEAETAYQALRTENHAASLALALLSPAGHEGGARYTGNMPSGALRPADPSDVTSTRLLHGCSSQGESDLSV